VEAAKQGVGVLILDENHSPGGQLFKQIHKFFGSRGHQAGTRGVDLGCQLLAQAEAHQVEIWMDAVVWGIFDGPQLGVKREGRVARVGAKRVLLATGASENALAFPGWTLPGVMGAGAAQTLMNLHRVLPGRRALMVGAGNVGLIIAYQLLQAGAQVCAVVEALPRIGGYGVHASKLRRCGVPILTRHSIQAALGRERVEGAVIVEVDAEFRPVPGTEKSLEVDTVCLAVGLTPMAELAWLAGCRFAYVPELGGHVPLHDANMQSTVEEIYVAGDLTGIEEAHTAMEEGRVAGISVAASLGYLDPREAEALKGEAQAHLDALRQGPFGHRRREAKERLLAGRRST
jgi:thioredoxin reductase